MRPPWVKISQRPASSGPVDPLGVDRDDDRLGAELLRGLGDDAPVAHRGGVDRHLVGAGEHQRAHVVDRAHAAADRHRHEAVLGGARHHVEQDGALLVARRDVEEAELVGAGRVVGARRLDRIAGVGEVDEAHALDDAAVLDVEAGDDAGLQHRISASTILWLCPSSRLRCGRAGRQGMPRVFSITPPRAALISASAACRRGGRRRARGRRWRRRGSRSRAPAAAPRRRARRGRPRRSPGSTRRGRAPASRRR